MCILVSSPFRLFAIADSAANEKTHTAWVSGRGGDDVQAEESHIISTETQCVWVSLCYTLRQERPVFFTGKLILTPFFASCKTPKIIVDLLKLTVYSCNQGVTNDRRASNRFR